MEKILTSYFYSASFFFYQLLSTSFNFYQLLSTSINFYQLLSASFNFFQFLSTPFNLPSTGKHWQALPTLASYRQCLSKQKKKKTRKEKIAKVLAKKFAKSAEMIE